MKANHGVDRNENNDSANNKGTAFSVVARPGGKQMQTQANDCKHFQTPQKRDSLQTFSNATEKRFRTFVCLRLPNFLANQRAATTHTFQAEDSLFLRNVDRGMTVMDEKLQTLIRHLS